MPEFWIALLADGLGGGIQMVATLVPPIFFIFLSLSVLEDSGYMARGAFVMDRLLHAIGLPGKAFLPMLIGFGCNVPAILATRTLQSERDRTITALINPFMSCGARLPVYILFGSVFFAQHATLLIFGLYLLGILVGIVTGLLLKRTVLRGQAGAFVMELPPYHLPTWSGIAYHTWSKLKSFVFRAGKVIIVVVILFSLLGSLGTDGRFDPDDKEHSVLSAVGRRVAPLFRPMGVSNRNWPAVVALISGVFAKEAVVGTLDALYTQLESGQAVPADRAVPAPAPAPFRAAWHALRAGFSARHRAGPTAPEETLTIAPSVLRMYFGSRLAALAYLVFVLIYTPCIAALAAVYRETGPRWATFSVLYQTGLAWLAATVFFQLGSLPTHPLSALLWLAGCAAIAAFFVLGLRHRGRQTLTDNAQDAARGT
jgi:ferrous iron transport protein B